MKSNILKKINDIKRLYSVLNTFDKVCKIFVGWAHCSVCLFASLFLFFKTEFHCVAHIMRMSSYAIMSRLLYFLSFLGKHLIRLFIKCLHK